MALDDFIKVMGLGKYSLPGLSEEELPSQEPQNLPLEKPEPTLFDRTSDLVKSRLVEGESGGIPILKNRSSGLASKISQALSAPTEFKRPINLPSSETEQFDSLKNDSLAQYDAQLKDALVDRERNMNESLLNAGATDFIAAGNRAMGIADNRRDTAAAELRRLEDIKLQNLNEQLNLSDKVLGSEKSKTNLQNMGSLNDLNSPITQAYRTGAKQLLGNTISDDVLNKLSGAQINDLMGVDLGNMMNQIEARKMRSEEMALNRQEKALDRELKRLQIESAKTDKLDPTEKLLLQDQLKENQKIRQENRKERTQLEKDITKSQNLVDMVKNAKEQFDKYSKSQWTGTGPIATLGGMTKVLNDDTQNLDSAFRTLSLDSMTKMFSGMSKAIDTNAERAAFEATQPSITNDDIVNKNILDRQLKAAQNLLKKQKEAIKQYDRTGNFEQNEPSQNQPQSLAPKYTPGSVIRHKNGKMYRVGADGDSLEEI